MQRLLFFLLPLFLLNSCIKEKIQNSCGPDKPTLTSNSPVTEGQTIELSASGDSYNQFFWSGPNGFTSDQKSFTIAPSTAAHAGSYSCYVYDGNCNSETASITVVVNQAVVPCDPTNNFSDFSSGIPDVTYYSVTSGIDHIYDTYEIDAIGNKGDLHILFSIETTPTPGAYKIVSYSTHSFDLKPGDVRVYAVAGGTFSYNYYASQGNLYVTLTGGKITATFCNISMTSSAGTITSTTKVTVN